MWLSLDETLCVLKLTFANVNGGTQLIPGVLWRTCGELYGGGRQRLILGFWT